MPQPQVPVQPQQGGFVIPPLPQAVAGAPPQPPVVTVNYPGVVPPVVPDPVVHFPVIPTPPGPHHVPVFPSPHDQWGGGIPEPVHPGPFMGHPMDDGPFVPHSPSDGSSPQVIVQPADPRYGDSRHSRTYTVPHSDRRSPSSDMPTQESFHQHPPVRPIPIPIPVPMGEHIPGSAISVPPSPTMGHPPAPQNVINVGTPVTPSSPGMPPPGQVGTPILSEPIIAHPPPMMGMVPMPASPITQVPPSMLGAMGPPVIVQPPMQAAQPVMPSPLPSRGSPVSYHEPIMHSPGHTVHTVHSPYPSGQVFQPTHEPPIVMHGSPSIQAYPDPIVVSVPPRSSYDSDYSYYGRRRPRGYYDDDDYYYSRPRRYRQPRSPYYDDYYPRRYGRRHFRDDDSYDSEGDDPRYRDGRRFRRPQPETTTADPSQLGAPSMLYTPTIYHGRRYTSGTTNQRG